MAYFSYESVAPLGHCLDILRGPPVIAKLLAESEDILRQRGLFDEGVRPHFL
jgi:hypothetical protein